MTTQLLPVDNIHIGERQRSDTPEAHIKELARDIAENGLIHAITVDANNELRAGFCRLNAVKTLAEPYLYGKDLIPVGMIPVVVSGHVEESALFRLELMENLRRKNLSPVDEAKAVANLHRLLSSTNEDWSKSDTRRELDKMQGVERSPTDSRDTVGDSLLIESFASNEQVAKAKSKTEAVKIAKKLAEQELVAALGGIEVAQPSFNHEVYHGKCQEILAQFADNSAYRGKFSGIVCDPPYGINADEFGEQAMKSGHQYEDSEELALDLASIIFFWGAKLCTEDAHGYIFCDIRNFDSLKSIVQNHGWKVFQTPLIWHKPSAGHAPIPGLFSRRYECILFAYRGERKLSRSRSDVFEFSSVKDKIHAAQKPKELLKELLSLSFFPGEAILDPCCGSGSIFPAAHELNLKATGIEADYKYYQISKQVIGDL